MQRLREVPSRLSPRTQMADVAAQFANQIYERHGLIEVARRFQFVTFNGERTTKIRGRKKSGCGKPRVTLAMRIVVVPFNKIDDESIDELVFTVQNIDSGWQNEEAARRNICRW